MTPRWMPFMLVLCLCGCAVTFESTAGKGMSRPKELVNLSQLRLGMSVSEVKAVLGTDVKVGYQRQADGLGIESILLKNPVKEESLAINQTTYRVLYFYTTIRKADDVLADDELTPLVFQKEKLVGIGRDSLLKLKGSAVK